MRESARGPALFSRLGLGAGDPRFAAGYFFLFGIYGITTPFLQVLIKGLGYGDAAVGAFLGLFEIAGLGGQLLLARLADRRGRYRPFLLLTALLAALAVIPLALLAAPLVTALAVIAMAFGVRGMVPVMDASVVAHTHGEGRPKGNYGLIRSVGSVGYIVMLLVSQGADLQHGSPLQIALWVGGAALLFILVLGLVPESGRGKPQTGDAAAAPSRALDPRLFLGLLIIGLGRLAMAPINSFFTLYVTDVIGGSQAGLLWAISAAAEVPALILAKRFIERFGPMKVLAVSTLAIALRLATYIFLPSLGGALLAQLLHFFCYGLFLPSAIAFVSSHVPPERRVWGMSMLTGVAVGLPSFLGSTLGGLILEAAGYRALFAWAILPAVLGLGIWALSRRFLEGGPGSRR